MEINEGVRMHVEWEINKFKDPTDILSKLLKQGASLESIMQQFPEAFLGKETFLANVGLNEGLQELIDLICGIGTPVKWDNTNAYLGVGDSSTAADPTQTGLLGTNKLYKAMDATYPQKSGQTAEWRSTFGSGDANFAWNEFTVSNANSDTGKNLNRKVEDKGTKASGETWTLSLKITFS